jgi:hypothetical protein
LFHFSDPWFAKLESGVKDVSEKKKHETHRMCISMAGQCSFLPDLRLQLAIKLLDFMRRISRSDVAVRASGEISSEAGGRPAFATGWPSSTFKELEPLSATDVARWVSRMSKRG